MGPLLLEQGKDRDMREDSQEPEPSKEPAPPLAAAAPKPSSTELLRASVKRAAAFVQARP